MAVTVKRVVVWRCDVGNRAGALADVLSPLAAAGADLRVVMGYRYPEDNSRAAIEVYPVATKRSAAAAQAAGLAASATPTLLVEGDNRPGLGSTIARTLGDGGIDMGFLVTQVIGRRYSCILGLASEEDARKAAALIKKATTGRRK
jgi:hypothetical protein